MAIAYMITWTTYGSWLRGDPRGSVTGENRYKYPVTLRNDRLRARDKGTLKHSPVELSSDERGIVDGAIRSVCEHRGWKLLAINVRSNHVHVVVGASERPEKVMVDLKAWSTRALRTLDADRFGGSVWTTHGSTRHLFHEQAVQGAIHYVLYEQDGTGKRP